MFSENLKNLRRQKGLSQEELAERLHVVRQTVSKWEKGLSVPDADFLIRISEIFETPVSTLLGDTIEGSGDNNIIAEKLEQLNILMAERNRRSRRIWRVVAIILISIVVIIVLLILLNFAALYSFTADPIIKNETVQTIEKWDRRPMVMVEGAIYMDTGEQMTIEIDDSAISGTITSSKDGSETPEKNGQSNFGCEGAQYAFYEEGLVVMLQNKWIFFEKEKD